MLRRSLSTLLARRQHKHCCVPVEEVILSMMQSSFNHNHVRHAAKFLAAHRMHVSICVHGIRFLEERLSHIQSMHEIKDLVAACRFSQIGISSHAPPRQKRSKHGKCHAGRPEGAGEGLNILRINKYVTMEHSEISSEI